MTTPFFTVIMPTYNRKEGARHCLESLAAQTFDWRDLEAIVAVDGSTDRTAEYLRSLSFPFALTILELQNGGAGRARNAAAALARGRFLAFTEDDVTPSRTWLEQAFKTLEDGEWDVLEGYTGYPGSHAAVRQFEDPGRVSYIPCNLFVRRDLFLTTGGYSAAFFDRNERLYFREDSDLGFRLLDAGARVFFDKDLLVVHPLQFQTMSDCFRHARRYCFDALLYKRHPKRYRKSIEVKTFGPLVVHRPQHYVALLDFVALITLLGGLLARSLPVALAAAGVVFLCGWLFRYKYQGLRSLRFHALKETAGFTVLPFVYLTAVVRGCLKYNVLGVLF
jgi:glycosyltransferase involved in cell wall biosynthesis